MNIDRRTGERRHAAHSVVEDRRGRDRRRGRPLRIPGEPASKRVEFRVTGPEHDDLARVADENGLTVAELLREAVGEYVADYQERRSPISSGSKSRPAAS